MPQSTYQDQENQGLEQSIKFFIKLVKEKFDLTDNDLIKIIEKKETITLPIEIFGTELGALEAIVKFLREEHNLRFCEIARLLKRDQRTIWATYSKSKAKHPLRFEVYRSEILVPLHIFSKREHSVLEALVFFLKEDLHKNFKQISFLTSRNYKTIWCTYQKAARKVNK